MKAVVVGCGRVGSAVALQLAASGWDSYQNDRYGYIAAIPPAHHSLNATEPIFEYDCSAHPLRNAVVTQAIQQQEGWVDVSTRPGLGIEVDREVVERFRAQ